jgi:hypothetical protein
MRFRTETQQERNARWAGNISVERRRYENPNFHIGGYLYDYRAITKCAS